MDSHDDEPRDNKGQGSECFGELKDWETFKDADQDIQKLFDDSVDQHLEGVIH